MVGNFDGGTLKFDEIKHIHRTFRSTKILLHVRLYCTEKKGLSKTGSLENFQRLEPLFSRSVCCCVEDGAKI